MPGQNYVFGQNWQGKSSIVDAIGFALFGADIFPKKVAGTAIKADHLLNGRATAGGVELTFDLGGTEYCLKRRLPARDAVLLASGEVIASGIRTVNERLAQLLGIGAKLFQNIFFSDQDDLRKSLEFSPEERRLFIERLLGVEEWKGRIESLRDTRRSLEDFLNDLTAGRLGVFLSDLDDLETDVTRKQSDLAVLGDQLKTLAKRAPRNLEKLRREEGDADGQIARLQHHELELATRIDQQEDLRKGIKRGKCPTCTQRVPSPMKQSRLRALGALISELQKGLTEVRKDLAKVEAFDDSGYQDLLDKKELETQQKGLSEQLARDQARLKKLRTQTKAFGKKPEQVEQTKAEIVFIVNLEGVIQEFRSLLRGRLVPELVAGTNDFLARFHDGDNDTTVKIDNDLNISVVLHGSEVPIFNLSGAAKDILALSLRYGLLRVAAKGITFLILDEPTRHMDNSNAQRLKTLFNDLLDRQLIVVTVNSEFSDAAGRHFRIAKNDSLESTVAEIW